MADIDTLNKVGLDQQKKIRKIPVAIQRLMDEVRLDPSPACYNRAHNRHNRSGGYNRAHNRHNR